MIGELFGETYILKRKCLDEEVGAGAKIGWGLRQHVAELSQDIDQLSDGDGRPTKTV